MAVIFEAPHRLALRSLALNAPESGDVLVEIVWSGISTGTEKLLFTGKMPSFPGLGYPLVPGYESVGRIIESGSECRGRIGEWVFVPGANCFADARGLFGGSARRLVVPSARALPIDESWGADGVLFALAATALHAIDGGELPDLVVGHGILGRLIARLTIARGGAAPVVWEINPQRSAGDHGYSVIHPDTDERRDYRSICDVSGDGSLLDTLIARLAKGGEVNLAGFYQTPLSFTFPPAFMREARIRVAAEWGPDDLVAIRDMVSSGALNLAGLVSHVQPVADATSAYPMAFTDPACLKMILDWSACT